MSKRLKADIDASAAPKKNVNDKTKGGIVAILFFVVAILFILAALNKAGFLGTVLYDWFNLLLGVGYFLIPAVFVMLGIAFLKSISKHFPLTKIIGSCLFVLSGLGAIDVLANDKGGIVGHFVGTPMVKLLDVWASMIVLVAFFVISILIIFESELTLAPFLYFWKKCFPKKRP